MIKKVGIKCSRISSYMYNNGRWLIDFFSRGAVEKLSTAASGRITKKNEKIRCENPAVGRRGKDGLLFFTAYKKIKSQVKRA